MNIRELAKIAGVGKTTVAYALQNSPRVNRETCRRIQALAKKHGYVHSPVVTSFMREVRKGHISAHKHSLAYISSMDAEKGPSHFRNYLEKLMIAGATREAETLGCDLDVLDWSLVRSKQERLGDILKARGIRGIFLGPAAMPHTQMDLNWEEFAVLSSGFTVEKPNMDRIAANLFTSLLHAAEKVLSRNYQSIAIVMSEQSNERVGWRWMSAATCLRETYGADRIHIFLGELREQVGAVKKLQKQCDSLAVISHHQFGDELRGSGVRLPEDMGFVSFDHPESNPEQTGIIQPHYEIGRRAVQTLYSDIEGGRWGIPECPSLLLIACQWNEGKTLPELKI